MPSILNVKEKIENRSCNDDNTWTNYRREYTVLTDGIVPLKSIRDHVDIPEMHETYSTPEGDVDADAILVRKEVRAENAMWTVYSVNCDYTTNHPLNRPEEVDYDVRFYQEAVVADVNNNPVVNSADEPFDPPPTVDHPLLVIRVKKNVGVFVSSTYEGRLKTVNNGDYRGYIAGDVYFEDVKASFRREMGVEYYEVILTFLVDTRRGWKLRLLDQGYREKYVAGVIAGVPQYKYRQIFDEFSGQPLSRPRLLNGSGLRLTPAQIAAGLTVFREFTIRGSSDFSVL